MPTSIINLKMSSRRMLTMQEAAEYCGMSVRHFELMSAPVIAPVDMPDRKKRYDLHDLDHWLDGLKNGDLGDDEILRKLR